MNPPHSKNTFQEVYNELHGIIGSEKKSLKRPVRKRVVTSKDRNLQKERPLYHIQLNRDTHQQLKLDKIGLITTKKHSLK